MLSEERKEELKNLAENKFKISLNDCCFIGGMSLEYLGIRKANDLDCSIKSDILNNLINNEPNKYKKKGNGIYNFNEDDDIYVNYYYKHLNITDDDIINSSKYHYNDDGIKIVRAELVYATKSIRRAKHDLRDIKSFHEYIKKNPNKWNWNLIPKKLRKKIMLENGFFTPFQKLFSVHKITGYTIIHILGIKITLKKKVTNNPIDRIVWWIPFKSLRNDVRWLLNNIITGKTNNTPVKINNAPAKTKNTYDKLEELLTLVDGLIKVSDTVNFLNYQRFESGEFCAYDTIVRYKVIEEYLDKNNESNYWENLYINMQIKRVGKADLVRFHNLINSFVSIGFDFDSSISCNKYKLLDDGSHRLASCLFFNQKYLSLKLTERNYMIRYYGIEWFKEVGFSQDDINNIEQSKEDLFYKKGVYFPVTIWSPMQSYFNEVEEYIEKIKECKIKKTLNMSFDNIDEFKKFTFDIYKSDDIADWKVERKFDMFVKYNPIVKIIWIEIPFPKYRKKDLNNHDISTEVERIKKMIRNEYKQKIDGYFHDVIAHIGDNFEHNRIINDVIAEYKKNIISNK